MAERVHVKIRKIDSTGDWYFSENAVEARFLNQSSGTMNTLITFPFGSDQIELQRSGNSIYREMRINNPGGFFLDHTTPFSVDQVQGEVLLIETVKTQ